METKFDEQLKKIKHYQKFPVMMPFIGRCYEQAPIKLLVLGESHYFPHDSAIHSDANNWYENVTVNDLNEEEKKYINTREILLSDWLSTSHIIYKNIDSALSEIEHFRNCNYRPIDNIAFMNAFQRPANEGDSIKKIIDDNDIKFATDTIQNVASIINPDLIIICSIYAWEKLHNNLENIEDKLDFTCNPVENRYWFKNDYQHNRNKFIKIIKEHNNK